MTEREREREREQQWRQVITAKEKGLVEISSCQLPLKTGRKRYFVFVHPIFIYSSAPQDLHQQSSCFSSSLPSHSPSAAVAKLMDDSANFCDGDADGHAMKLAYFRNAVENLNVSTKGVDDSTCLRFLKARSMHINKGAIMYVQYHTWRTSFVPLGHIPAEHVVSELNANKCGLQGYSKKGCPLMIVLGGKHYPNKKNLDTFKKYVVHLLDKSIASAPAGVEKIIAIVDLNDLGFKNVDVKGYITAFQILQTYYPERLEVLYMVNVPRFFHGIWKVVARFLDQATKEKIVFVEDHMMTEVLLSEVDAATLPTLYGGKANIVLLQDAEVPNWPGPVIAAPA